MRAVHPATACLSLHLPAEGVDCGGGGGGGGMRCAEPGGS